MKRATCRRSGSRSVSSCRIQNQTRGIGTNQINVFGKVLVQKKFGDVRNMTPRLNLMGNLGLEIMTAPSELFTQNDLFLYGLAGIYRVSDHVNIASEVNGRMKHPQGQRHRSAPKASDSSGWEHR